MYRFLESICFKSGSYQLLELHQKRVNSTFSHFFPEKTPPVLTQILPKLSGSKKMKVRMEYDSETFNVQMAEYHTKNITQLKVVQSDDIDYSFKYADRSSLEQLFSRKSAADDILIIRRGLVTDSSYANLIFKLDTEWVTPKSRLLNGIKRQYLLNEKLIVEKDIPVEDLEKYNQIGLINAMLDPGEVIIPMRNLIT